jgi:hypothetical protein
MANLSGSSHHYVPNTAPSVETELRNFIADFSQAVTRSNEMKGRIGDIATRLSGEAPPEAAAGQRGLDVPPSSLMNELRATLSRLQDTLNDMAPHISRIERVV